MLEDILLDDLELDAITLLCQGHLQSHTEIVLPRDLLDLCVGNLQHFSGVILINSVKVTI